MRTRPSRDQNAEYPSSQRKRKRLSEKLLDETAAARPERPTDGQFFAAGGGAR